MSIAVLKGWARRAGLDEHVLPTLLFRGWSVFAGAALILLLPLGLSPVEQGFYYTFASVLALQIFFELGLSQVMVQLVSLETAHLTLTADHTLAGDASRVGRLASLAQLMQKWYRIAAVLFGVICTGVGSIFFFAKGQLPWIQWGGVWAALVVSTAVNLSFLPRLALLEGAGQLGRVARLRLVQGVIGYAVLLTVLALGGGLWVAVVIPCVSAIFTWHWLQRNGQLFQWLAHMRFAPAHAIDWKRDVLPFQWRIALSWISGFFIFYLFIPLVFAQRGAVEAGRLGMAMTVFSAISTVGMSWVNAKTPSFAMHISRGERDRLNALFQAVGLRSVSFTAIVCSIVLVLSFWLASEGATMMSRIADPVVLVFLAVVCVANTLVFAAAAYMRAHGEEPMLAQSMAMGASTLAVVYFGSRWGVLPMVAMYAGITLFISLPWAGILFLGYHRRTA